jgi:hypothetical protein
MVDWQAERKFEVYRVNMQGTIRRRLWQCLP